MASPRQRRRGSPPSKRSNRSSESEVWAAWAAYRTMTELAGLYEMSPSQLVFLLTLRRLGPSTGMALADALRLGDSTVSRIRSPLTVRGLVAVGHGYPDGRSITISITNEGLELLTCIFGKEPIEPSRPVQPDGEDHLPGVLKPP